MKDITIAYTFHIDGASPEVFPISIDAGALRMKDPVPGELPGWTVLDFHQCPNCPLPPGSHAHCPFAVRIAQVVQRFTHVRSFDEIFVEVCMEERTISRTTTAQKGISSLMGLICAVSGCPLTEFLRPMARFHLPLATQEETICRAVSLYLLTQYFRNKQGGTADFTLQGLVKQYHDLQTVNMAMAKRIRAGSSLDAPVNALVILDTFAKALPFAIEDSLDKIEYIFLDQG